MTAEEIWGKLSIVEQRHISLKTIEAILRVQTRNKSSVDWDSAPEWAKYIACDEDGSWYWYSQEPSPLTETWDWEHCDKWAYAKDSPDKKYVPHWKDTLEKRP